MEVLDDEDFKAAISAVIKDSMNMLMNNVVVSMAD